MCVHSKVTDNVEILELPCMINSVGLATLVHQLGGILCI